MILFWVCSPSHHHCQGFLSLPNLFHVLPNGWESSSCGCPGLPRNDQFPRSCPNTNTSHPSSAGSGRGQVGPNPPHQSDQEGPTITPRPQQQPLEWPQKEATPAASAKIDSLSGSWQIKGFLLWDSFHASSGSSSDLQGLDLAHRCNTRYQSLSHASPDLFIANFVSTEKRGLEGNDSRVAPVSLPTTGGRPLLLPFRFRPIPN